MSSFFLHMWMKNLEGKGLLYGLFYAHDWERCLSQDRFSMMLICTHIIDFCLLFFEALLKIINLSFKLICKLLAGQNATVREGGGVQAALLPPTPSKQI